MLRGNLSDFPLDGVLQLIARDRKTGFVRINEEHAGSIGVRHGIVVDAAYYPSKGERALSLLNSLSAATFEFDVKTEPMVETIRRPMPELLIELNAQHARWLELRARLSDWSAQPQWLERPEKFKSAEQALVASFVTGARTIESILHECSLHPLRSAEVLLELCDLALLTLGLNPQTAQELAQPQTLTVLSVYHPNDRTVFVDRALYSAWQATFGRFKVNVASPKGERATYAVEPRDRIPNRIMIPSSALRKLRVARGARVLVSAHADGR
jgi:hypothetical protein